jgi:hypothetical protein
MGEGEAVTPADSSRYVRQHGRLNASTESMPSSMVPFATKLMTCTGRTWSVGGAKIGTLCGDLACCLPCG